jgi:hypothetical protein
MVLVTLMTATHTYRFSEFQAGLVESGKKSMTIRAPRKAPTRAGDTLRLTGPIFAGFAKVAPQPGRLLRTAVCRGAHSIELRFHRDTSELISIDIGGQRFVLEIIDAEAFARLDGFANALEMGRFFRKLHGPGPFRGVLIRW